MSKASVYQFTREDTRKHGGQYVAVLNGKIVASGENIFKEAERIRKDNPGKEVAITYVPTEDLLIL